MQMDAKKDLDIVLKNSCFSLKQSAIRMILGECNKTYNHWYDHYYAYYPRCMYKYIPLYMEVMVSLLDVSFIIVNSCNQLTEKCLSFGNYLVYLFNQCYDCVIKALSKPSWTRSQLSLVRSHTLREVSRTTPIVAPTVKRVPLWVKT